MEAVCGNDAILDALPAGTALSERYVIVKVIGSGGFGITYLAYDTEKEKKVAVKEYYPRGIAIRSPDGITIEPIMSLYVHDFKNGMERFGRESEILSRLCTSTDVIKVFDSFAQNGTSYYTMEYVLGITLKEYTQKYGRASEGEALYIALKIVSAFEHIHCRNIIHRDLSPDNIMIDTDGNIRLVDFGNARPFSYDGNNSMTAVLNPGYAPLEQYQRHGNCGPWTDIYSLGAVLYHTLTLNDPKEPMTRFKDDSEFKACLSQIDKRFAAVITKMTELKIEKRYAKSEELLSDLNALPILPQKFKISLQL